MEYRIKKNDKYVKLPPVMSDQDFEVYYKVYRKYWWNKWQIVLNRNGSLQFYRIINGNYIAI